MTAGGPGSGASPGGGPDGEGAGAGADADGDGDGDGDDRARRLGEVARLFLRLGVTAFGGPAAHIAMMHDEVVRRRGWVSNERFVDLVGGLLLVAPAVGMTVGSGIAGKLIHTAGPRALSVAMVLVALVSVALLTGITATTDAGLIALVLGLFGLGAGLGMPAMPDTVMAAVPERDAGVGSALNDVSRQLGGALGIAVIGSVVNDAYRSDLADRAGDLDPGAVEVAGEGVGVASRVAATLPPDAAAELTRAANDAYVDAITRGFALSAAVLLAALVVAVTMIPRRMRRAQAQAGDGTADVLVDQLITPERQPEPAG